LSETKFIRSFLILLFLAFSACNGRQPAGGVTPQTSLHPIRSQPAPEGTLLPPTTLTPPSGPVTLLIWLPPEFDPASGKAAGNLLQARLAEFNLRRPGVHIEVRIKGVSGPGSLLDALVTTSAAAPTALPDLIALRREQLETAAIKGLLRPYDHLTKVMDSSDWYGYAQQLSRLQDSVYGLPFAGDGLLLAYRTKTLPTPPTDWPSVLETNPVIPLVFAAGDPRALFTLAQYQASGGLVRDDQGRPVLDPAILSRVLKLYTDAAQTGLMTASLAQMQDEDQVWKAFQNNQADCVAIWASQYLNKPSRQTAIAPIPTADGHAFTIADGWVWALDAHQVDQQALSVELAEYLTESSFLASWTEAAGYLPPRPSSLEAWSNSNLQSLIKPIVLSAHLQPAADVLTSLGNPLQQATFQVLGQQEDPSLAAQKAASSLTGP